MCFTCFTMMLFEDIMCRLNYNGSLSICHSFPVTCMIMIKQNISNPEATPCYTKHLWATFRTLFCSKGSVNICQQIPRLWNGWCSTQVREKMGLILTRLTPAAGWWSQPAWTPPSHRPWRGTWTASPRQRRSDDPHPSFRSESDNNQVL